MGGSLPYADSHVSDRKPQHVPDARSRSYAACQTFRLTQGCRLCWIEYNRGSVAKKSILVDVLRLRVRYLWDFPFPGPQKSRVLTTYEQALAIAKLEKRTTLLHRQRHVVLYQLRRSDASGSGR